MPHNRQHELHSCIPLTHRPRLGPHNVNRHQLHPGFLPRLPPNSLLYRLALQRLGWHSGRAMQAGQQCIQSSAT